MWQLNYKGIIPKEELKSVFTHELDVKGRPKKVTLINYTNSLLNEYFNICTSPYDTIDGYTDKIKINSSRSATINLDGFYDFLERKKHFKKWVYDSLFELKNISINSSDKTSGLEDSIIRVYGEISDLDRFCNFFKSYFPVESIVEPDPSFYHVSFRKELPGYDSNRCDTLESKVSTK